SFDDYTVAAFKQQTGLDAKHDLKLGDFSNPNFRKWIDFRIQTFTNFIRELDQNAKSVNPKIKTIPEIYPGIEEEAVRVGVDVYSLYPVVDAIAHEYEFGDSGHMASERDPLGVYFSPATRNFHAKEFIASYRGVLILLMQKHLEFQIVTPRTLSDFHGKTLVLPDVRELSDDEKTWVQKFVQQKNRLVITGTDATGLAASDQVVRFPNNLIRGSETGRISSRDHQSVLLLDKLLHPGLLVIAQFANIGKDQGLAVKI